MRQFSGKVAVTVKDYTNHRETDGRREAQSANDLYICCKFTCGLLCCEASVLWNAVKYTVTDCCVNTGIQIPLD